MLRNIYRRLSLPAALSLSWRPKVNSAFSDISRFSWKPRFDSHLSSYYNGDRFLSKPLTQRNYQRVRSVPNMPIKSFQSSLNSSSRVVYLSSANSYLWRRFILLPPLPTTNKINDENEREKEETQDNSFFQELRPYLLPFYVGFPLFIITTLGLLAITIVVWWPFTDWTNPKHLPWWIKQRWHAIQEYVNEAERIYWLHEAEKEVSERFQKGEEIPSFNFENEEETIKKIKEKKGKDHLGLYERYVNAIFVILEKDEDFGPVKEEFKSSSMMKPVVLPPLLAEPYGKPYTIAIDLDCLIDSYEGKIGQISIKRPGLDFFLSNAAQAFEIVLFTSHPSSFKVRQVYDKLDPTRAFVSHFLYNKQLSKDGKRRLLDSINFGRPSDRLLVIGHNEVSCERQPDNCLMIPKWDGNPNDAYLFDLLNLLHDIVQKQTKDIREVVKDMKGKDITEEYKSRRNTLQQQQQQQQQQKKSIWSLGSIGQSEAKPGNPTSG